MARRRRGLDLHGWLVLDKPAGMTSTRAVARARGIVKAKKAGHAGTLDPLATGILPLAFGEATKTIPFLMEAEKVYRFTIKWGVLTDTLDAEGDIIETSPLRPDLADIEKTLKTFLGQIDQVPPKYSAIKIRGERAYDLARLGESFTLSSRSVMLYEAELEDMPSPDESVIRIRTGKGFYVRALVRDLAQSLGVLGHVVALRRLQVGIFKENEAISLENFENLVHKTDPPYGLLPVGTALDDIPALVLADCEASQLKQGRSVALLPRIAQDLRERQCPREISGQDASRWVFATCGGEAVAIAEARAGQLRPKRVFYNF